MRLRPLTGQVLVEILPAEKLTAGGIEIPQRSRSPEERHEAARRPEPPPPVTGIVKAVGPWPKTKQGLAMLPEFQLGDKVLVGFHAGVQMQRSIGERLRMVRFDQVLAVLESVDLNTMLPADWDKFEQDANT